MQCEICGRESASITQIDLDGVTLIVCEECATFGKEKEKVTVRGPEPKPAPGPVRRIRPPRFQEQPLDLGLEIVPDFGERIRKARQSKNLTVKELAMCIFEKESLLHRIENKAIKPSDKLIEKLQKQLGIELKKKAE